MASDNPFSVQDVEIFDSAAAISPIHSCSRAEGSMPSFWQSPAHGAWE